MWRNSVLGFEMPLEVLVGLGLPPGLVLGAAPPISSGAHRRPMWLQNLSEAPVDAPDSQVSYALAGVLTLAGFYKRVPAGKCAVIGETGTRSARLRGKAQVGLRCAKGASSASCRSHDCVLMA